MKKILFIVIPILIVLCIGIFVFLNVNNNKKYDLEYDYVFKENIEDNYLNNIKDLLDEYDKNQKEEDKLNNREIRDTKYTVTKKDNNNYKVVFECNDLDKDDCQNLYKSYISYVNSKLEIIYGVVNDSLSNNYKFIEK